MDTQETGTSTIEEKKKLLVELRKARKSFEQSAMIAIAAAVFVIYDIIQSVHDGNSPWYFYVLMAVIAAAITGIGIFNYLKSKRAGKKAEELIKSIKAENPDEPIPEESGPGKPRFF